MATLLDSKSFNTLSSTTTTTQPSSTFKQPPIQIQADSIPALDETSLKVLNRLTACDKSLLEFTDTLQIFALTGQPIGHFTINVTSTIYKRQRCFLVQAKSTGTLDEVPCGTDITATVNERLETLEQNHYEYISFPKGKLDRKTILTLTDDKEYTLTRTENAQNATRSTTHVVEKALMNGYVSEAANILLQRLMTQARIYEKFELFTFDNEANPCLVAYKPIDTRVISIQGDDVAVQGVERTVESVSDIPTTWQVYFSQDGHMINRVQVGYPAVMKSVERPRPIEVDEYMPKIQVEKRPLKFESDMELKSNYLDRKVSVFILTLLSELKK